MNPLDRFPLPPGSLPREIQSDFRMPPPATSGEMVVMVFLSLVFVVPLILAVLLINFD